MILYSLENIFDIIKNNLKASFSLSLLFMLIALTINSNNVFSKSLSTGLHRIRNQRTGTILYVNSDGRIVVTSNDNNSSLNEIRDAFTKEIKYVTKIIKSNHTSKYYNDSDTEGVGAYITDDLILGSTSCYDENGNTINIGDKNIAFAFNNYLFFSDGTVYDTFMQTNFNLNGVNDNISDITLSNCDCTYNFASFNDYFIVQAYYLSKDSKKSKFNLHIYNKSLTKLKTLENMSVSYTVNEYDFSKGEYQFLITKNTADNSVSMLDNNLETSFIIDRADNFVLSELSKGQLEIHKTTNTTKYYNSYIYDIYKKNLTKDTKNRKVPFSINYETITSTINVDDESLILNDLNPDFVSIIYIKNKPFLFVSEKNYKQNNNNYIYDLSGKRLKILKQTEKTPTLNDIDQNFLIFQDSSIMYVYNDKLELIKTLQNGKRLLKSQDKYFVHDSHVNFQNASINTDIYDENFNLITTLPGSFREISIEDRTYYVTQANFSTSLIYNLLDENFNVKLNNIKTIDVINNYIEFKRLENYDDGNYYIKENIEPIKYKNKYLLVSSNNFTFQIYDSTLKKLGEIDINSQNEYHNENIFQISDDILLVYDFFNDGLGKYSLYQIGVGYILKDIYYIGNITKDYFTFLNGFNYGLMDYNLNVLCSYSIFDNFQDDIYESDDYYGYDNY